MSTESKDKGKTKSTTSVTEEDLLPWYVYYTLNHF